MTDPHWTDPDPEDYDGSPPLPMAGMDEQTGNMVLREMARRRAAGLPEVPGDWDD